MYAFVSQNVGHAYVHVHMVCVYVLFTLALRITEPKQCDGHACRKEFKALEITAVAPNTSINFAKLKQATTSLLPEVTCRWVAKNVKRYILHRLQKAHPLDNLFQEICVLIFAKTQKYVPNLFLHFFR